MAFFHTANFLVSPSECVVRVYSVVKKGSRTQYRESWFKDYRKESAVLVTFTCFPRGSDSQNLMKVKRSFPILWPICYSLTKSYPTFVTPWTVACQASLLFTISQSLLKLMSIESMMPSNHLILCHPLFLPTSVLPSIRVFSNELALSIRYQSIGASASASVPSMNIQVDFL